MEIYIRYPQASDKDEFLQMVHTSKSLHFPWVAPPETDEKFNAFIQKYEADNQLSYLVIADNKIAGVINVNEIIRGVFQSAFLGYYASREFAGKGVMTKGLQLVLSQVFTEHNLHRVEANIQPENIDSLNLVRRCGFHKEGFSPKYLKILGEWKDHERWALINEAIPSQIRQ